VQDPKLDSRLESRSKKPSKQHFGNSQEAPKTGLLRLEIGAKNAPKKEKWLEISSKKPFSRLETRCKKREKM